jgi:hypothetical protein
MACNQYQEIISDYIDGSLSPGEQTSIEHHLAGCETCRVLRDDMIQLVHFSRQLPLHTPSGTVWTKIESQVAAERPISIRARVSAWLARLERRSYSFSLPQLAGATIALALLLTAGVVFFQRDGAATIGVSNQTASRSAIDTNLLSFPDFQQLESRINQLEQSVEQRKSAWPDELRIAYERNLSYVNQSLVECRQQLSGNPSDRVSEELMLNAYREKVRLLEGFDQF